MVLSLHPIQFNAQYRDLWKDCKTPPYVPNVFIPTGYNFPKWDVENVNPTNADLTNLNKNLTFHEMVRPRQPILAYFGAEMGSWRKRHSDHIRALALHFLYNVNLVTVGQGEKSRDNHINAGFPSVRGWQTINETVEEMSTTLQLTNGHRIAIGILDYFWLEAIYFRGGNSQSYGEKLFVEMAPCFFQQGGEVLFLPNDCWGEILTKMMVNTTLHVQEASQKYLIHFMTMEESLLHHPLLLASLAVEQTSWYDGYVYDGKKRKTSIHIQRLNQEHPFIMCYRRGCVSEAYAYVDSFAQWDTQQAKQKITQKYVKSISQIVPQQPPIELRESLFETFEDKKNRAKGRKSAKNTRETQEAKAKAKAKSKAKSRATTKAKQKSKLTSRAKVQVSSQSKTDKDDKLQQRGEESGEEEEGNKKKKETKKKKRIKKKNVSRRIRTKPEGSETDKDGGEGSETETEDELQERGEGSETETDDELQQRGEKSGEEERDKNKKETKKKPLIKEKKVNRSISTKPKTNTDDELRQKGRVKESDNEEVNENENQKEKKKNIFFSKKKSHAKSSLRPKESDSQKKELDASNGGSDAKANTLLIAMVYATKAAVKRMTSKDSNLVRDRARILSLESFFMPKTTVKFKVITIADERNYGEPTKHYDGFANLRSAQAFVRFFSSPLQYVFGEYVHIPSAYAQNIYSTGFLDFLHYLSQHGVITKETIIIVPNYPPFRALLKKYNKFDLINPKDVYYKSNPLFVATQKIVDIFLKGDRKDLEKSLSRINQLEDAKRLASPNKMPFFQFQIETTIPKRDVTKKSSKSSTRKI